MRILLSGYGKMGREVEKILLERGHSVSSRVDPIVECDSKTLTSKLFVESDIVIDFSHPSSVWQNIQTYLNAGIPSVIGTTGWESHRDEARKLCLEKKGTFLWGSNFSIGAHLFFTLVGEAARIINTIEDYDIALWENHHNQKAESPSGTALTTAKKILDNLPRKTHMMTNRSDSKIDPSALHVASLRVGAEPGLHEVVIDGPADTLRIQHHTRNRSSLAKGSVLAAEWLEGKQGFFSVEDFISERFS